MNEKENYDSLNFDKKLKMQTEFLSSKPLKNFQDEEKNVRETSSLQDKLRKYSELEKCALKILNDFD